MQAEVEYYKDKVDAEEMLVERYWGIIYASTGVYDESQVSSYSCDSKKLCGIFYVKQHVEVRFVKDRCAWLRHLP